MTNIPATTEELRNSVFEIGKQLREGRISNPIARTLLHEAKIALDTLRIEMEATRLGADFSAVFFKATDRNGSRPNTRPNTRPHRVV